MATGRHDDIGPTGHYTAYVWHRLGLPYADLFATRRGASLYWGMRMGGEWIADLVPSVPSMTQYLGHRHRLIESQLRRLEPDHVVELGAGLSRRGITWALDHGVRYTEVDLPHMVEAKRARIASGPPSVREVLDDRLEVRTMNILDQAFPGLLADLIASAERPVVITEGVISYFDFEARAGLLRSIAEGFRRGRGGHYITDLQTADAEASVGLPAKLLRAGIRAATKGRGAGPAFRTWDHVREMFASAGFDDVVPLEADDHACDEPALKGSRSPSTIVCARAEAQRGDEPA